MPDHGEIVVIEPIRINKAIYVRYVPPKLLYTPHIQEGTRVHQHQENIRKPSNQEGEAIVLGPYSMYTEPIGPCRNQEIQGTIFTSSTRPSVTISTKAIICACLCAQPMTRKATSDRRNQIEVSRISRQFLIHLDYKTSNLTKLGEKRSHHGIQPPTCLDHQAWTTWRLLAVCP